MLQNCVFSVHVCIVLLFECISFVYGIKCCIYTLYLNSCHVFADSARVRTWTSPWALPWWSSSADIYAPRNTALHVHCSQTVRSYLDKSSGAATQSDDPLEAFCLSNPDADECRCVLLAASIAMYEALPVRFVCCIHRHV